MYIEQQVVIFENAISNGKYMEKVANQAKTKTKLKNLLLYSGNRFLYKVHNMNTRKVLLSLVYRFSF